MSLYATACAVMIDVDLYLYFLITIFDYTGFYLFVFFDFLLFAFK